MAGSFGLMTSPSTQMAERKDDRKINVSGNEFVFNADAVKYWGLQKINQMQDKALMAMGNIKRGLPADAKPKQPTGKPPMAPPMGGKPPEVPGMGGPPSGGPNPMNGLAAPPPGMPPQQDVKAPEPTSPNQPPVPQQQRTNFATGGYVAPSVPTQPNDWMQYQDYYKNMNRNSGIQPTRSSVNAQGASVRNYVDPSTNRTIPTQPVGALSTTVPAMHSPSTPMVPGGGGGGGKRGSSDMTSALVTSALVGAGIPIAGQIVKGLASSDIVKSVLNDVLGIFSPAASLASTATGVLPTGVETVLGGSADAITSAGNVGAFTSENALLGSGYGTNTYVAPAAESAAAEISEAAAGSGSNVLEGSAGADLLGTGGAIEAAAAPGAEFLGGASVGADAFMGSAALAETGSPIGLASLGGADGLFGGIGLGATQGGMTGAMGGLMSAAGYAAPALAVAMFLSAIGDTGEDWGSTGYGTSTNLGDLTGDNKTAQTDEFFKSFLDDKSWLPADADLSTVGRLDFDILKGTGGRDGMNYNINGFGYDTQDKAIQAGRDIVLKRLGAKPITALGSDKITGEQYGGQNAYLSADDHEVVGFASPIDWKQWHDTVDRRNSMGTGEGAEMYRPITDDSYYNGLDDEAQSYLALGWTPGQAYLNTKG